MLRTEPQKNIAYNNEKAYLGFLEWIGEQAERLLDCSEPNLGHPDIVIKYDVYHFDDATIIIEGVHNRTIGDNLQYHYAKFSVSASSKKKERKILSDLEKQASILEFTSKLKKLA